MKEHAAMKKTLLLAAVLSAALVPAARAWDARLEALEGKVMVKTGGGAPYEARKGDPLFYGDEVRTEKDALAHVVFKDGTAVLIKGGSALAIKGRKGDTFLHFDVGEFLIGLKKKLSPQEKFRVKTPAAVAAVRGTLFWGLSDPSTKDTTYACFEHKIEITAQGKSLLLEAGQKVKIPFGKPPEAAGSAADIPADYVNTFKADGSLQGLDQLMPAAAPAPSPAQTPPSPSEPPAASTAPAVPAAQ
jgi:ferric-dicitrate binding protein FerR (iron transport regulator)